MEAAIISGLVFAAILAVLSISLTSGDTTPGGGRDEVLAFRKAKRICGGIIILTLVIGAVFYSSGNVSTDEDRKHVAAFIFIILSPQFILLIRAYGKAEDSIERAAKLQRENIAKRTKQEEAEVRKGEKREAVRLAKAQRAEQTESAKQARRQLRAAIKNRPVDGGVDSGVVQPDIRKDN